MEIQRPFDGNDDGLAVADIGVDEFWLGLQGSSKTAVPLAVRPAISSPTSSAW